MPVSAVIHAEIFQEAALQLALLVFFVVAVGAASQGRGRGGWRGTAGATGDGLRIIVQTDEAVCTIGAVAPIATTSSIAATISSVIAAVRSSGTSARGSPDASSARRTASGVVRGTAGLAA